MAVFKFFPVVPNGTGVATNVLYSGTITAGATSTVITTGNDMLIRIATTNPIAVRFGPVATLTTATALDLLIPGSAAEIFDMGHGNSAIVIYALATTNVSVNVVQRN